MWGTERSIALSLTPTRVSSRLHPRASRVRSCGSKIVRARREGRRVRVCCCRLFSFSAFTLTRRVLPPCHHRAGCQLPCCSALSGSACSHTQQPSRGGCVDETISGGRRGPREQAVGRISSVSALIHSHCGFSLERTSEQACLLVDLHSRSMNLGR